MDKCFEQPLLFMGVDRGLTSALLGRFREELNAAGLSLPDPTLSDDEYLCALCGLMMSSSLPAALNNTLHAVDEMANESGRDCLEDVDCCAGVSPAPAGVRMSDLEFAISAWLHDSKLFEQLHCAHRVPRQRPFTYFAAGVVPPPGIQLPATPGRITALEELLAGASSPKCPVPPPRVFAYPKDNGREVWFLVGINESSGRPRQNIVVYNAVRGELRVNCCRRHGLETFRKAFGLYLFDDAEFFRDVPMFTLAPLVEVGRACLTCAADVGGIEAIRLDRIEFMHGGAPWHQPSNATDIFTRVERGELCFPPAGSISRSVFEVKFPDSRHPRHVTVIPPNRVLYERDADSTPVGYKFAAGGFMLNPGDAGAADSKKTFGRRWLPLAA